MPLEHAGVLELQAVRDRIFASNSNGRACHFEVSGDRTMEAMSKQMFPAISIGTARVGRNEASRAFHQTAHCRLDGASFKVCHAAFAWKGGGLGRCFVARLPLGGATGAWEGTAGALPGRQAPFSDPSLLLLCLWPDGSS